MKYLTTYKLFEGYDLDGNKVIQLGDYLQTLFDDYDVEFCETELKSGDGYQYVSFPNGQPTTKIWQYEWCQDIGKCGIHIGNITEEEGFKISNRIIDEISNIESFLGSRIKVYKGHDPEPDGDQDEGHFININVLSK